MIRAEIVVRAHTDPEGYFTQFNRYVVYNSKKGQRVISTDKGTAIPINYLRLTKEFSREQDMKLTAPRSFRGFRIKFFKTREELFKYAEINHKTPKNRTNTQQYKSLVSKITGKTVNSIRKNANRRVEHHSHATTRVEDPRKVALYSVLDGSKTLVAYNLGKYPKLTPEEVVGGVLEGIFNGIVHSGLYTKPLIDVKIHHTVPRPPSVDNVPWKGAPWSPLPSWDISDDGYPAVVLSTEPKEGYTIEQKYETPKANTKVNVEERHDLNVVSRLLSGHKQ